MYYNTWLGERHQSWGDFWEKIKSGERATWLKSTGNPCNCVMCSKYNKYIRPQKQYMLQEREYKHHGGWKGVWKDYKE